MNGGKTGLLLAAAIFLFVVILGVQAFSQVYQPDKPAWSDLKIVAYGSGLTGFFDPDTGMYYIYDSQVKSCIIVRRLTKLGNRMKVIEG